MGEDKKGGSAPPPVGEFKPKKVIREAKGDGKFSRRPEPRDPRPPKAPAGD